MSFWITTIISVLQVLLLGSCACYAYLAQHDRKRARNSAVRAAVHAERAEKAMADTRQLEERAQGALQGFRILIERERDEMADETRECIQCGGNKGESRCYWCTGQGACLETCPCLENDVTTEIPVIK